MANYSNLLAQIAANIYSNDNKEITGDILQLQLNAMINSLGAGYQCAGIATPDTDPGTPDQRFFYIAGENGTYINFDGLALFDEIALFFYDENGWHKQSLGVSLNLEDFAYVAENGFFIVDEALNIGFSVDNNGAHAKNILDFEIVQ